MRGQNGIIISCPYILKLTIAGTNFALFRPAIQSSTFWDSWENWEASKAVDGDITSASMTNDGDAQPWWKVQLDYPVWVTRVEIINIAATKCM